ncbi:MAG: 4-hydroxythreonine-4-phosphate dehydrogenase PdxA [Burkholderiaceae bacterium]|nr:4-hydroxythreonine-4-phosphate dehydrogenase PdxA [Burkholderiaceae bacterium]
MGDACGIGPEIILKAFAAGLAAPAVVIGDPALLEREARRLRLALRIVPIASPAALDAAAPGGIAPGGIAGEQIAGTDVAGNVSGDMFAAQVVPVIAAAVLPADLVAGAPDARAGEAAYRCIAKAAALAMRGEVRAVTTAPISKSALHMAGRDYPGHTELLAELAGGVPVRMMLANSELRTVLVTIHLALRDALDALTADAVEQTIRIADRALRDAGIAAPRIAVAGVNPHAGESGAFGREEIDLIAPAIARARAAGIDATGPHPPDTVFMHARGFARHDVVVAMYHDQGLIPVKYLGIDDGVNITIGLPFVRTSPDHGTAFDLAGRVDARGHGLADARSLLAAIRRADELSRGA